MGTRRVHSLPIEATGQPISVAVFAPPYLWLRGVLAEGVTGRALSRLGYWWSGSTFRAGGWTRFIGGGLIGAACGRAIEGATATPAVLAVVGVLLAIWGPWLLKAASRSQVFGPLVSRVPSTCSVSSTDTAGWGDRWVATVGVVLCFASGMVAGLAGSSGPIWLAGGVLASTVAVALLWRPEAILLIAAIFPWADVIARQTLGGVGAAWDEALILVALLLVLWGALVTGRLRLRTVPATLPALCVFVAAIGSIVVRAVPSDVGIYALRLVIEPVMLYFVGFLLTTTGRWLRATVGAFLASTSLLALHGLYQFIAKVPTPRRWLDSGDSGIVTRAFSIMGKPNQLGVILAISVLISVALLLAPGMRRQTRLVLGVVAVIHLGAVAVTFSRSAWLGLACGVVVLFIMAYRKYLLPLCGLAVVGLLATPRVFIDRFLMIFSDYYLSRAAVDGRIWRWNVALDHIDAHPWFGNGLGTFGGPAATRYNYWILWVDNYYLQLGAQGGLLLLAAFLWLLLTVARGLVKSFRIAADPFVRALAAGVFAALVAVSVSSAFFGGYEVLGLGAAIWLIAGVTTSAGLVRSGGSEA